MILRKFFLLIFLACLGLGAGPAQAAAEAIAPPQSAPSASLVDPHTAEQVNPHEVELYSAAKESLEKGGSPAGEDHPGELLAQAQGQGAVRALAEQFREGAADPAVAGQGQRQPGAAEAGHPLSGHEWQRPASDRAEGDLQLLDGRERK